MATKNGKACTSDALDETNFRDFAQKAIAKYEAKNMVIDAMLWSAIVGHYERALDDANQRAGILSDLANPEAVLR